MVIVFLGAPDRGVPVAEWPYNSGLSKDSAEGLSQQLSREVSIRPLPERISGPVFWFWVTGCRCLVFL